MQSVMATADRMNLEIRAAAYIGADITIEMAAGEDDTRAAERDPARALAVEIGVAAIRVQLEAEPDENPAARPGAGIFARLQFGGGGGPRRPCKKYDAQP